MTRELSEERLALLRESGFRDDVCCGACSAFHCAVYVLDTKMTVKGQHATDRAYIIYAREESGDGMLDGFFYAPTLLEYMLNFHYDEWDYEKMMRQINRGLDCEARIVDIHGIPMVFIEIYERAWEKRDLGAQLSDILKIVGQLDYLLPPEWLKLIKQ